jgi:mannose/cellobiose epimerase-like protein (N-acyl-D-glucosamine 2-epimerase family)
VSIRHYLAWLRDEALPFWLEAAADSASLFYETLDNAGAPQLGALRLRTGMRQVFVFASAAELGLADRGRAVSLAGGLYAALRRHAFAPDGAPGWVAGFDRDGRVLDARRYLYDHAFVALAQAHLASATGQSLYLQHLEETFAAIDLLQASGGGWHQSDLREPARSQNPHMHLFEACLGAFENTGQAGHLARAGEIFGLMTTRFFDHASGLLTEFFGPSWRRSPEFRSERLDPGHMMEWTWLLRRYQRLTNRDVGAIADSLFASAYRLGRVEGDFLVDEMDAAGKPLVDRRRLWPQTEYLKGLLVQAQAKPPARDELLLAADALAGRIVSQYLCNTRPGTWRDQFSLDGSDTAGNIPASSLYHLMTAAPEIIRILGAAEGEKASSTRG